MDPIVFGIVAAVFTAFGYFWGRGSTPKRSVVELIVGSTMNNLEKEGYLKSETVNGEIYYVKWPSETKE
jgi:hypothetical protein